ncbi:MAG: hypothetical protein FWD81_01810 [Methanomassiliicoccaceae archaeon]|nr:hypothetical protein [Methanomassiliicoccaceae archaeon]
MNDDIGTAAEAVRNVHKEKEAAVSAVFLSMFSGKGVVFIGPGGTGRGSMVSDVIGTVGGKVSRYMVSPTTDKEELIARVGDDSAIFVDDVFRANSGTLNGIADIMSSGRTIVIGSSSRMPSEDDEAYSLYDRFLFRASVGPLRSDEELLSFIGATEKGTLPEIRTSAGDVRKAADDVSVDDHVLSAILSLRDLFKSSGKYISDERWKDSLYALKVAAAAAGGKSVGISYIPLLQHTLWDSPEEIDGIRAAVFDVCTPGGCELNGLFSEAEELLRLAVESKGLVDENAGFPRIIHCYDCNSSFPTLRRLKEHSASRPRHTYADPHIGKDGSSQDYIKYTYEELVTLLTSKYGWDLFKKSDDGTKEKFMNAAAALRKRKETLENSHDGDRAKLEKELAGNFWLTGRDRKDIMTAFNLRSAKFAELGRCIADVEFILK